MKKTSVLFLVLSLTLTGCSSTPSIESAVKDCRPPGNHTWVNPIDGEVRGQSVFYLYFERANMENLDPNPICILEKLDADQTAIQELKTGDFSDKETTVSWDHGEFEVTHSEDGHLMLNISTK